MASAPQNNLPLLYKNVTPLSTTQHKDWKAKQVDAAPWLVGQHAIPITVDEFPMVQRYYPIVFASGEGGVPLALMGLNEGVNMFVDEQGTLTGKTYVPAYVRRYPFLLARLREGSEELSLCFDETAGAIGPFEEGQPLFEGEEPSELTKNVLTFCEQWEQSWAKTAQFMTELQNAKLLTDGEVTIQPEGAPQPFVYRGFRMVSEEALREVRGDQLRKLHGNGILPLIYSHLFSLGIMSELFQMQGQAGRLPHQAAGTVAA